MGDILRKVKSKRSINRKLKAYQNTAAQRGVTVFGLDDEQCWTGQNAVNTYDMYGTSQTCKANNRGNKMGSVSFGSVYVYKKKTTTVNVDRPIFY